MGVSTRLAGPDDAAAIARIYNQGIEDRVATFETEPRSPEGHPGPARAQGRPVPDGGVVG
jgi:L-amino acid N-acyltransferase YncA